MELKALKETNYWIEVLQKGDEKALSYFFDLHYKSLCYFAGKIVQDEPEAEDIVATCFYKFWERRNNFENFQSIKGFLYISCRNACLNFLKQLQRRTASQEEYVKQLEIVDVSVLNHVVESEFLNVLHQEVQMLPDQCKAVFSLIYFEGKKTDEIARILDISVKTVRNHKSRAIELLHNSYLKKGVSDALLLAIFLFLNKR